MSMLSNVQVMAMLLGTAALGCSLNDRKDACTTSSDCLDGVSCVNHTCGGTANGQPDAGGTSDSGPTSGDNQSQDAPSQEYGAAEPITAHSTGLATAPGGGALLGTTGVAGNLGCALVGDEASAPGTEASLVYAKIQSDTGDSRCPTGTYAIQNNPAACPLGTPGRLLPGCAVYKRWDASGTLVARRLAIGGFVTVLNHGQNSGGIVTCDVELGLSFAGGTTIQSSFSFDFNVLGSSESFCVH